MAIYTWTHDKLVEFNDLYKERPCLYSTKHKNYFNRDTRSKALSEITSATEFPGAVAS